MKKEYSRIKRANNDIVYLLYIDDNRIKLEMPYNTIGDSFQGVWVNSPIENVARAFRQLPDLERVYPDVLLYLERNGFIEVEPCEIDKILYK